MAALNTIFFEGDEFVIKETLFLSHSDTDSLVASLIESGGKLVKKLGDSETYVTHEGITEDCPGCFLFLVNRRSGDAIWSAWYCPDESCTTQYGIEMPTTLFFDEFGYQLLAEIAGTCPVCGRYVGARNLEHVAFADRACEDCAPALRRKLETPGWYN